MCACDSEKPEILCEATLSLKNESVESGEKFLKSIMGTCAVELAEEVGARTAQRYQDLELTRRSKAGDTKAFDERVTK